MPKLYFFHITLYVFLSVRSGFLDRYSPGQNYLLLWNPWFGRLWVWQVVLKVSTNRVDSVFLFFHVMTVCFKLFFHHIFYLHAGVKRDENICILSYFSKSVFYLTIASRSFQSLPPSIFPSLTPACVFASVIQARNCVVATEYKWCYKDGRMFCE